jgi:hypothetical protein
VVAQVGRDIPHANRKNNGLGNRIWLAPFGDEHPIPVAQRVIDLFVVCA